MERSWKNSFIATWNELSEIPLEKDCSVDLKKRKLTPKKMMSLHKKIKRGTTAAECSRTSTGWTSRCYAVHEVEGSEVSRCRVDERLFGDIQIKSHKLCIHPNVISIKPLPRIQDLFKACELSSENVESKVNYSYDDWSKTECGLHREEPYQPFWKLPGALGILEDILEEDLTLETKLSILLKG